MITNLQKQNIDAFCRAYLITKLECNNLLVGEKNQKMIHYIIHELSYEDALLATTNVSHFLSEERDYKSDIQRQRRIEKIENMVSPFMSIGLPILASKEKVSGPLKKLLLKVAGSNGASKLASKMSKMKGGVIWTTGSMAASLVLSYIVQRIIFVTWEKSLSVCKSKCNKLVPGDTEFKRVRRNICTSMCKIDGLNDIISKLRIQIRKCSDTENPERCQTVLVKNVGTYNDMLVREQQKLRKNKYKLDNLINEKMKDKK